MGEATDLWREDFRLKEDQEDYVKQGLMRREICDFMTRDYPNYRWSIRTLDRRLRFFNIFYNDRDTTSMRSRKQSVKSWLVLGSY